MGILSDLGNAVGGILGGVGNAVEGLLGGASGNSGAQAAAATANPFAGQYQQYQAPLAQLINNPSSFQETAGQQAAVKQGMGAVNSQMAAQGLQGSTAQGAALTNYATTQAGQFYEQDVQNLMALSGLTTAGSSGATTAGQILAGQNSKNQSNLGALIGGVLTTNLNGNSLLSNGINGISNFFGPGSTDMTGFATGAVGTDMTGFATADILGAGSAGGVGAIGGLGSTITAAGGDSLLGDLGAAILF